MFECQTLKRSGTDLEACFGRLPCSRTYKIPEINKSFVRVCSRSRIFNLTNTALAPPKEAFDVGEFKLDVGRATVIALARVRRHFHLAQ